MSETNFDDLVKMSRERMREWSERRKAQWESLFPMTLNRLAYGDTGALVQKKTTGRFVSIRAVESVDPEGKTRLGVYLGELNSGIHVEYNPETQVLTVYRTGGNPAIFVPDLARVVMGYESWWKYINTPDDLRQITDADIDSVWYVRALKVMSQDSSSEE